MAWARKISVALSGALAVVLAGCTSLSGVATIEKVTYAPVTAFDETIPSCAVAEGDLATEGITFTDTQTAAFAGVLRSADEVSPKDRRRFIFHTHGMGMTTHCKDFLNPLTAALQARGYRSEGLPSEWLDAPTRTAHYIRGEALPCNSTSESRPCKFTVFGQYRIDRLKGPGGDRVVVYSFFWHRDLWRVQLPFVNHDLQQNPGKFAKPAKELVDGGLGDAAAYVGEMGTPLREGMSSAVCAMLREAANVAPRVNEPPQLKGLETCLAANDAKRIAADENLQISFISHSLGSRMLFDVLGGEDDTLMAGMTVPAREALAARTDTFLMAANQLPLLGAGRVRRSVDPIVSNQVRSVCDDLPSFLAYRCLTTASRNSSGAVTPRVRTLDVVGFVDPGDLLGFRVSGGMTGQQYPGVRFINVRHRNAPQILWLGTWPTKAHDQELNEPSALSLILCGGVETDGKLKPRACGSQ